MKNFRTSSEYLKYASNTYIVERVGFVISMICGSVSLNILLNDLFKPTITTYIITGLLLPILALPVSGFSTLFKYYNTFFNVLFSTISIMLFWYFTLEILNFDDIENVNLLGFIFIMLLVCIGGGIAFSQIISVPFKLIDKLVIGSTEMYYNERELDAVDNMWLNDGVNKRLGSIPITKTKKVNNTESQYETKLYSLSEIELQIELNNAIGNEDYEKADIIKKVLNNK